MIYSLVIITLSSSNVIFINILNLVEFILAILGTNAAVETAFSIMNFVWTDEKSGFNVDSTEHLQHFCYRKTAKKTKDAGSNRP